MQVSRITLVWDYHYILSQSLSQNKSLHVVCKVCIPPFVLNFACVLPAGRRCRCSLKQKPRLVSPSLFDILTSFAWVFVWTETPPVIIIFILHTVSGLKEMKKLKQRLSLSPRVRFTIFCNIYWSSFDLIFLTTVSLLFFHVKTRRLLKQRTETYQVQQLPIWVSL